MILYITFKNTSAGNWQLLWMAQDQSNVKGGWASFINPLGNQSYSSNPFLRRG